LRFSSLLQFRDTHINTHSHKWTKNANEKLSIHRQINFREKEMTRRNDCNLSIFHGIFSGIPFDQSFERRKLFIRLDKEYDWCILREELLRIQNWSFLLCKFFTLHPRGFGNLQGIAICVVTQKEDII
jgi:hypothetical protein